MRRRFRRRLTLRLTVLGGVALGAFMAAFIASSFFSASPTAQANTVLAGVIPKGATPTASVTPPNNSTVTITFAPAVVGSTTLTSYTVKRYNGGTSTFSGTISGSCALNGGHTLVTCTDTPGDGTWFYTDTPTFNSWAGPASGNSNTVSVDSTPPTSSITFPVDATFYNTTGYNSGCATPSIGDICGAANDAGTNPSGVNKVQVSIQNVQSGQYWNGSTSAWVNGQVWNNANGTTSWNYGFAAANLQDGVRYDVQSQATDNAGNVQTTPDDKNFTLDKTPPTAAINFPLTGSTYGPTGWDASGTINGTASDSGSGVTSVKVAIQDGSGNYYDGSGFNSVGQTFLTATGTTSWSYAIASSKLTNGHIYHVTVQTTDATITPNTDNAAAAASFMFDSAAPTATITFPAAAGAYNTAGWNAGGNITGTASDSGSGVASVNIAIQDGSGSYFNGTSFSNGSQTFLSTPYSAGTWSYSLVSSALTDGHTYHITIETIDNVGNTNTSAATRSFDYDTSAPNTATLTTNAAYNTAGWPGAISGIASDSGTGSHGISAVNVSIKDSGTTNCWNGTTAFSASCPHYIAVTSGGTAIGANNANWSYTLAVGALTDGHTYTVQVKATDGTTNGSTSGDLSAGTFAYDTSAPNTATLTTNGAYNTAGFNALGGISGTVSDSGTGSHGINAVNVSIKDSVSGKCWNGTDFTHANCPNYVAVTSGGTATGANNANWSYTLAAGALTDGHTYTVQVQATDATTNGNTSGDLSAGTFKYDTTAPNVSVTFPANNGNYNAAGWTSSGTIPCGASGTICGQASDATSGISGTGSISLTITRSSTTNTWNGTSFASGTNTVNPTTYNSGTGLWTYTFPNTKFPADDTYTVAVTATDQANNTSAASTNTFKYDTAAPATTITINPASPNGTNGWYKTTSPTFTLSATDPSPGSGVATTKYQIDSGAVTTYPGSAVTIPDGQHTISYWSVDNANNTEATNTTPTIKVDTINPTGSITAPAAAANVRGASVTVQSNSADSGSGVASAEFQRSPTGLGTWTDIGTVNNPGANPSVTWDTTAVSDGQYDLRVITTDKAGNTFTSALVTVRVDNTPPVNVLSLSNPTGGGAFLSGTTVYYHGAVAGSFTISNALTDTGGSGPASSTFPTLGGTATNWTHTASTVTTQTSGAYVSTTFSWTNGTVSSPTELVTGTDNAGNTNTGTTLTFVNDSTPPVNVLSLSNQTGGGAFLSGTTVYYHGAVAGSFTISNALTDTGGSGPASSTFPTLGGTATNWTHTASTVTTQTSGAFVSTTFSWTNGTVSSPTELVTGTDNVGNTNTGTTLTFVNDSTPPVNVLTLNQVSGTASLSGTTVSYNGSVAGSFTITNSLTDTGGSGPASSTFAALGGTSTGWTFTSSTVTTPAGAYVSNTYSWNAGTTSSPTDLITGTDNVGNTNAGTTLTFTNVVPATATFAFPVNGGVYTTSNWNNNAHGTCAKRRICGTATAGTGSVTAVKISVADNSIAGPNNCWDGGGSFNQTCPHYVPVTGTTSWTTAADMTGITSGHNYTITLQVTDGGGTTTITGPTYTINDAGGPSGFSIASNPNPQNGKPDAGDEIIYTYSTTMDPNSILSGWNGSSTSVTVHFDNNGNGGTNNGLTVTGTNLGNIDLGTTGYVSNHGSRFDVAGTMVMTTSGGKSLITITLTGSNSNQVTTNTTWTWQPSASATDLFGNASSTSLVTESSAKENF